MNQPWPVSPFRLCCRRTQCRILRIDSPGLACRITLPRLRLFEDRQEFVRNGFLDNVGIDFSKLAPDGILASPGYACIDRSSARLPPVSFSSHVLVQLLLAVQRSHIGLKTRSQGVGSATN